MNADELSRSHRPSPDQDVTSRSQADETPFIIPAKLQRAQFFARLTLIIERLWFFIVVAIGLVALFLIYAWSPLPELWWCRPCCGW